MMNDKHLLIWQGSSKLCQYMFFPPLVGFVFFCISTIFCDAPHPYEKKTTQTFNRHVISVDWTTQLFDGGGFNNSHPQGLGPLYQKNFKGVAQPQNYGNFNKKNITWVFCNPKSHGWKKHLPTNYGKKTPQNTWPLKLRERTSPYPTKGKIAEKYRKSIIFKHTLGGDMLVPRKIPLLVFHPTNWWTEAQVKCKAVAPCISVASTLACASNKWRATCDFVWTQCCCWTLWDWKGHCVILQP